MRRAVLGSLLLALLLASPVQAAEPGPLPSPVGSETPRVEPDKEENGLYHQKWFHLSFLDLREDFEDAKRAGLRFAVIFEQRGCPYCTKMHTEILSQRYINDYVRQNFRIVQLDMFGSREVTDFDGTKMSEKMLAEVDGALFGSADAMPSRRQALERLVPYVERHLRAGGRLNNIVRHILGLYHGRPRARAFRRHLSEQAPREGAGIGVLLEAIAIA